MKNLIFKIARQTADMTQQELALSAGVTESLIARIESGRIGRLDRETAERIAVLLNKRPWEVGV